jgi:hypothetical protein
MTSKEKIIAEFKRVKALGFVKSNRKHNTGIGKTFEDLIGVKENNDAAPDFEGYEIKSQRTESSSYVTLFTKSPSHPKRANAYLKDTYGTPYEEYPDIKKIHTSLFATKCNTYMGKFGFKLINDEAEKKIKIGVCSLPDEVLIDDSVYYTYDAIESKLLNKLDNLFFVNADRKHIAEDEHFHFNKAIIYERPTIENFIKLMNEGKIMFDIRIGSYKSGTQYGKPHDHGSGFRIKAENIVDLYSVKEIVE